MRRYLITLKQVFHGFDVTGLAGFKYSRVGTDYRAKLEVEPCETDRRR